MPNARAKPSTHGALDKAVMGRNLGMGARIYLPQTHFVFVGYSVQHSQPFRFRKRET
ncbi:MAG: hypothetical protein ABJG73_03085 [Tateyamaria sp.]|uniref:hypothetical protein n=1 Tax=Tateyamaria sp. TaxID=1929288 RepID=UPI0032A0FF4F